MYANCFRNDDVTNTSMHMVIPSHNVQCKLLQYSNSMQLQLWPVRVYITPTSTTAILFTPGMYLYSTLTLLSNLVLVVHSSQ